MKRYCQMLELVNDKEVIEKYVEAHAHVWPEVMQGQHEVGILDMQIYRHGNKVFMISPTPSTSTAQRQSAQPTPRR